MRSPVTREHQRARARANLARVCTHRQTFARCASAMRSGTQRGTVPPRTSGSPPVAMTLTWGNATRRSILSQVACELATNATLHSHSRNGGHFTVRAQIHVGRLRVEVCDDGGPWTRPAHGRNGQHGRGLLIVAQLAHDWGRAGDSETGWIVWFEIDCQ